MKRDLKKLASNVLDVLVVGGGAHGATIAYHTAMAGYKVAIVDKNDFCNATSANSLKIIHGGLRYLQHLNIKRMRHSIIARREMMQLAPHLVQPLSCIMPAYGHGMRGRKIMQAALFLNDCISWDRNVGLPANIQLPSGFTVNKQKCQELIPGINDEDLHGASVWYDAIAIDTERLILTYLLEAANLGALAANYTQATGVNMDGDGLYCASLKDMFTQQVHIVKTRFIVNAAGPWIENLFPVTKNSDMTSQKWAMALNIIIKKNLFGEHAVALEGNRAYEDKDAVIKRGKRLYFFVPWHGHTMIGTDYQASTANPDCLQIKREDIQNMLDDINAIYPPGHLTYEDVSFYHVGLLPMSQNPETKTSDVQLVKNSQIFEYDKKGFKGIFSIQGVKYTTAPHIATELVHLLQKRFSPAKCVQNKHLASEDKWQTNNQEISKLLKKKYGQQAAQVSHYIHGKQDDAMWIDQTIGVLKAEIEYLIQEEMACTLADVIFRRTGLGTAECPSKIILEKIAAVMAEFLNWDKEREKKEIDNVLFRYSPLILSV
jgi:glycerol-3-phosphate dehydrogenase